MSNYDPDPHTEGYDACLEGEPETANPYDALSEPEKHTSWNDGWIDGSEELDHSPTQGEDPHWEDEA